MKSMTCIICPRGCKLKVEKKSKEYIVTGQMCKRGKEFALNEIINPTRTVTTTVKTSYPELPRLPVKTDGEIPLGKVFAVMKAINNIVVKDTKHSGEIIIENIENTGVNIIAAADMYMMLGV